jgi:hypothetical protein
MDIAAVVSVIVVAVLWQIPVLFKMGQERQFT